MPRLSVTGVLVIWLSGMTGTGSAQPLMTAGDLLALPQPPPDHRLAYGSGPQEFGELRLPPGETPHPVAVLIHGGCWRDQYDLAHLRSFAAALTERGIATWSLEYRRLGQEGAGWPGTFQDVAHGLEFLAALAKRFPLDLDRVVLVGHSAGGHLALWLAAGGRDAGDLASPPASQPVAPRGVVALAAVPDLRAAAAAQICGDAVPQLLGGAPDRRPDLYDRASPSALLPLDVPQVIVHGVRDAIVPVTVAERYAEAAAHAGDDVRLIRLPDAGHFELVAPGTPAFRVVLEAILNEVRSRN